MQISLLLADDEAPMLAITEALVREWNPEARIVTADSPEAAEKAARQASFTMALLDLNYETSSRDGFSLLASLRKMDPNMELVVLSSASTFTSVQRAMREGAGDYLAKGFGRGELFHALDRALERRRWKRLEARVKASESTLGMAGNSAGMQGILHAIRKFGPLMAPVLVFGETGTGKELAAKGLHAHGPDSTAPFVAVNCAAVPESTADSFFFGHERGAFTGADRARVGVFEEADGGTLFLDEINSMPLEMQGKLLRVLEQKEVRRLGGNRVMSVEFRIVAATNADLEELVQAGRFREDLYYRLNTLQIRLPALRERREDLPALAQLFQPQREIDPGLWGALKDYAWPGNIRELRNFLTAMDALAEPGEILSLRHIPEHLLRRFTPEAESAPADASTFQESQAEREIEFLKRAYRSANGNVSQMARLLGVDRSHLHQKLVKLGVHKAK